jgi:hypothetical protein
MSAMVAHLPDRESKLRYLAAIVLMAAAMAILPGTHAVRRHGQQALAVRQCMDSRGPAMVFQDRQFADKLYLLCELRDDTWGLQIVKRTGDGWKEITSFIPKDGTLARVLEYVSKSASLRSGGLP